MVNYTIFAGGFSTFIASYLFDSESNTLTLLQQVPTGANPSWIASHPQNTSILYAVNEIEPVGNLQSFVVQPAGGLTLVDTVQTGGNGPTFTNPLSTGEVSAINFGSPNASFIATVTGDPLRFETTSPVVSFPVGDGPSNPHMSLEFNGEIFVPDLGADKIWRIVNDGAPGLFRVQGQIDVVPGNGPRHIAIQDNILFTLHEKTSSLTAQPIPMAPNGTTLPLIANVSIIPPDQPQGSTFAAAEILISKPTPKFPDPLIYVSNRNTAAPEFLDPRGDSIAIFEFQPPSPGEGGGNNPEPAGESAALPLRIRTPNWAGMFSRLTKRERRRHRKRAGAGGLVLLNQVFTGLKQIRSMSLGRVEDGGDEFLIAGANVDGGVVMYRRIEEGRNLLELVRNTELQNRTSFVFV